MAKQYKGLPLNMSYRDFCKLLTNNGYTLIRSKGDHNIWGKEGYPNISVNTHPNMMVMRRLIKENNLLEVGS